MNYSLGNMLGGSNGSLNPDKLSLDLQFATDKTLTARKGPTPVFTRASSGTFVNTDGIIVGKTAGTTSSITPSSTTIGSQVTVTVASGSVVGWVVGQAIALVVDTDADDQPDTNELWLLGNIVSTTPTTLTFTVTSRTAQAGSTTSWTLGYRGARFDHDPITLACKGLLIEESRTNLVFPSDTLTTQTRTVTATAHTLSFYGTGTVVLSGVAIATVTGTGAYPTRTTLTFTPTAGSLIMTVTGSVTQAQLEAGSFPTSYIPTTTASVVRSVDVCSIASISSFYTGFGTILVGSQLNGASMLNGLCGFFTGANQISVNRLTNNTRASTNGASPTLTINSGTLAATLFVKSAFAFNTNDAAFANNGVSAGTSTSVAIPSVGTFGIGTNGGQTMQSGTISEIKVFKKRLANAKLLTITV